MDEANVPIDIIHQVDQNGQWHNQGIDAFAQFLLNNLLFLGQLCHMDNLLMTQVHLHPQLRLGDGIFGSDHGCWIRWKILKNRDNVPGPTLHLCAGSGMDHVMLLSEDRISPVNPEFWRNVGEGPIILRGKPNAEIVRADPVV